MLVKFGGCGINLLEASAANIPKNIKKFFFINNF